MNPQLKISLPGERGDFNLLEKPKKKSKKKFIIIAVIVLLLLAAGFFYWWTQIRETPPKDWDIAESSPPEDYIVKETPEGKIVENEKAGLTFKIPEGWELKKPEHTTFISLYSPGAVENTIIWLKNGCRINLEVRYVTADIEAIKTQLKSGVWSNLPTNKNQYEIIKLNDRVVLKNIVEYQKEESDFYHYHVSVYIPIKNLMSKNKVYSIELTTSLKDKEKCSREFDKFLETVSID